MNHISDACGNKSYETHKAWISPYIIITKLFLILMSQKLPYSCLTNDQRLLYLFHYHYYSTVSEVQIMIIQTVIRFSWAHAELMYDWLFCRLDGMIHPSLTIMLFCKTRKMVLLILSISKSIEPNTSSKKDINVVWKKSIQRNIQTTTKTLNFKHHWFSHVWVSPCLI